MSQPLYHFIDNRDIAENVSPESRHAWEIWKKLTDFSEFLWEAYEYDFLTLAADEPSPYDKSAADKSANGSCDNLPF